MDIYSMCSTQLDTNTDMNRGLGANYFRNFCQKGSQDV